MPTPPLRLPSLLRLARLARGWSQRQVAEAVETNSYTVTRWEQGRAFPSPYFRQQLVTLFGLTPEELGLVPPAAHPTPSDLPAQPDTPITDTAGAIYDPLLPPKLSPSAGLIGRAVLLAQLKTRLLVGGTLVLSALQGLPGVGKTALALALAHDPEVQAHFVDGILWTGLGQTPQVSETLARWGTLLGLTSTETARLATREAWAQSLRTAIGTKRLLFILDDVWHLEDVLACQVGGAGCAMLVTTRRPDLALQIAGAEMAVVSELGAEDGLALLARLAPALVETEPEAARTLVQAVGGLPLGLLLLGKHLHGQSYGGQSRRIRAALERLQQSTERLRLTQPQAPVEAHPSLPAGASLSLQASIGLSMAALPAQAQVMLSALALFPPKPNSFSEEAALAVSAGLADTLDTLVDAGLMESAGAGRYQLHQTIADFAREKRSSKQHVRRLVTFFADDAQAHQHDYSALERESTNALAALQTAYTEQMSAALIQTVTALAPFWHTRGLYETAELYLLRAQEAARSLHDLSALATILWQYGRVLEQRGEYAQAEEVLQEGLALGRQIHRLPAMSQALHALGVVYLHTGNNALAQACLEEGLSSAEQISDDELCVQILVSLARLLFYAGNHAQGEVIVQQGLALARKHQQHEWMSALLQNLGLLNAAAGNQTEGIRYFTDALAEARLAGHRAQIALALSNLGSLVLDAGDLEQAEGLLQESLAVARDLGNPTYLVSALVNIGELALHQERYEQAERYLQEGLPLARALGHAERLAAMLHLAGLIACRQGKLAEARAFQQEGLAVARAAQQQRTICLLLHLKGACALQQGQLQEATAAFQEVMALAEARQYPEIKAEALFGLAQVLQRQGETTQAHALGLESFRLLHAIQHARAPEVQRWLEALAPAAVKRQEPLR